MRYKRIKITLTKKEIRELKEGRAGFLVNKEKGNAYFMDTLRVNECFSNFVKALTRNRNINEVGILEPLEAMEANGWLFANSYTQFGYIKIDDISNKVKVFINTRN